MPSRFDGAAGAPKPMGPYSACVETDGLVLCSGQIGRDPETNALALGMAGQTSMALLNLEAVLKSVGLGLDSVVKTTVFITDMTKFRQMNDEYAKHFGQPYPARSTVQVAALPSGAEVEIEAIAVRGTGRGHSRP